MQKGQASSAENPTHAIVWVAKTYPPWQNAVLTTLQDLYKVLFVIVIVNIWTSCVWIYVKVVFLWAMAVTLQKAGSGNVPDNKLISTELMKDQNLKKYAKKLMPFVQVVKVSVST